MNAAQSRKFFIFTTVCVLCISAFSALGLIWLRQQISRTADRTRVVEMRLVETERRLGILNEQIAMATQPGMLQARVAGQLRPSREHQVVFMQEQSRPGGYEYAVRDPFEVSVDLALLQFE